MTITPAFQGIGQLHADFLGEALTAAPAYGPRVADAIKRTIRCIHGLERLHRNTPRDELEVYLGRATVSTLANRWRTHWNEKSHTYGAVLFTCDHQRVERLEAIAVKVLIKLHNERALCVGNANKHASSAGGDPRREEAIVYMTWRTGEYTDWAEPGHEV